ncbi:glycosyltransferase involved in cell wall biosynthesis [Motilibacter rhizosphaerae]|uniref:Glycosyltransferase involved in cell wall biosynthesis n=1 Tax=Motilibacter rhizosphaerae TaxID=598652 RepID=A0A4Q7NPX4_9ACTN|nr:glycosyltransferase [Motilibacter rhizosphaerae]RZS87375.1 glycosyltransferase involved in cell wall biosynthesis [Motilibacter rhizosphaerae]
MRALRVLHVTQPTTAGVARWVAALAQDQSSRGWDVTVASPQGWIQEECERLGVRHVLWEASRSPGRSTRGEIRTLRQIVRRGGFDVVHLHSSKAGLAGRLALRGALPTVFQPHCWSFQAAGGAMGRASLAWEKFAARWASSIVCVSNEEKRIGAEAGIPADRLVVIRNGVDLKTWTARSNADRAAARAQLGVESGVPVVVTVGRLAEQKGQDLLLAAWPKVREAVPEARLYLVGDGPMRPQLEQLARSTEGVHLIGDTDGVADWYAAADVVALPSRWEGLALAVLEAAASGRSVVATNVSGMEEVLSEDGASGGAVVPLESPELATELANAVIARLRDPQLALSEGDHGRARVEAAFDLREAARQTAVLAVDLASTGRTPLFERESAVASTLQVEP